MCETLCNVAVPVLPHWKLRTNDSCDKGSDGGGGGGGYGGGGGGNDAGSSDSNNAVDVDDNAEEAGASFSESTATPDLGEFVYRLGLILNNCFRLKPKVKTPTKTDSANKRDAAATAGRRTTALRRLSGAATATMTPAEIIGAILNSVGVLEGGAAAGIRERVAARRRSTSAPAVRVDEELEEEEEEEEDKREEDKIEGKRES